MAARNIIHQQLRDVEDESVLGSFRDREGEIVSGIIQQGRDPRMVMVDLGDVEAVLPPHERVPGEEYPHGRRLRAYVIEARRGPKGPQITLSRSHPNLVRRLFALEVPEVADGTVEIAGLAREAGHRTKMAVVANTQGINAKGACIGEMGTRVRAVMNELGGENIDIVDWSGDPARFIAAALSPASVVRVDVLDERGRPVRGPHRRGLRELHRLLPPAGADRRRGGDRAPGLVERVQRERREEDPGKCHQHPF